MLSIRIIAGSIVNGDGTNRVTSEEVVTTTTTTVSSEPDGRIRIEEKHVTSRTSTIISPDEGQGLQLTEISDEDDRDGDMTPEVDTKPYVTTPLSERKIPSAMSKCPLKIRIVQYDTDDVDGETTTTTVDSSVLITEPSDDDRTSFDRRNSAPDFQQLHDAVDDLDDEDRALWEEYGSAGTWSKPE